MDLLDFNAEELYFDENLPPEIEMLLDEAAEGYAMKDSELSLRRALFLEPEHLTVLVALYRFYYFQHRYQEALGVAEHVLGVASKRLGIQSDWRLISITDLGKGVKKSMTLMRFYLFALKGAGYLELRLGHPDLAIQRFEKVLELDASDRMGVAALMDLAMASQSEGVNVQVSG